MNESTFQNFSSQDQLLINTLRILSAEMVQQANSGHPGMPMGAAAVAHVLWNRFMAYDPKDPKWPNRDRFVLSAGHGSALLYSLLHLAGYNLSLNDLKRFRQLGSPCAGHPEFGEVPGVETTTGPLGQGVGVAVGMAMAERYLGAYFNRPNFPLIDHHIYCMAGDGCLMEGIASEAASLAGHLGLGKLILLYDSNRISIDGSTDLAFTEDVGGRFKAYGWHVYEVDGLDLPAMADVIAQAKATHDKPHLVICKTHIGYGSPNKQDSEKAHGEPLGADELKAAKQKLGWTETEFFKIPDEALQLARRAGQAGSEKHQRWQGLLAEYTKAFPKEAEIFQSQLQEKVPAVSLPKWTEQEKPMATRKASGLALNAIAKECPWLIGGSADLAGSNNTNIAGEADFLKNSPKGRNLRFGVREHAMGAILNGLAHSDILLPYGGTFLIFSDYMRPSIRLAALMGLSVVYVFTHDSIFLGEDGPTHQPIEHLSTLRAMPKLCVIRPADAKETAAAWAYALKHRRKGPHGRPIALCLTRQNLPVFAQTSDAAACIEKGAYVVRKETAALTHVLIATGSEVALAMEAAGALEKSGKSIRVVSMPCREHFLTLSQADQDAVIPRQGKRVVVEAGVISGWEGILGRDGVFIGMSTFGASAPAADLAKPFGFTVENLLQKCL